MARASTLASLFAACGVFCSHLVLSCDLSRGFRHSFCIAAAAAAVTVRWDAAVAGPSQGQHSSSRDAIFRLQTLYQ